MTQTVKQPFAYYGGKQTLARRIVEMIPEHRCYVEPFAGGASVFWAKQRAIIEVLNDLNGEIVNFYRQMRDNGEELCRLVELTPYAKEEHALAVDVYRGRKNVGDMERARLFFLNANASFAAELCAGFGRSRKKREAQGYRVKQERLPTLLARLSGVTIDHMPAVDCIMQYDTEHTFFYVDPPYVDAYQGHYAGFTREHLAELVDVLKGIKGKFILSGYHADLYPAEWHTMSIDTLCYATKSRECQKREPRTELLTSNFVVSGQGALVL
jgi:DNA adenine methylase